MFPNSKSRTRSLFSLNCSCKDSKSVTVPTPLSDTSDKSTATTKTATTKSFILASTSSSTSFYEDQEEDPSGTPSYSGLLRQLSDLEKNVIEWAPPIHEEEQKQVNKEESTAVYKYMQHKRRVSEGGRIDDESVAVVKESEDPLSDFRKSMLQMIVEKEIVDGDELRELLHTFLQINSRKHHDVILRAFADIWNEVFAGYESTPDLLRRSNSNYYDYYRR